MKFVDDVAFCCGWWSSQVCFACKAGRVGYRRLREGWREEGSMEELMRPGGSCFATCSSLLVAVFDCCSCFHRRCG